jgi:membrane protein
MLLLLLVILGVLYYTGPNARHGGVRWVSGGALVAIVVWLVASLAFAFYVTNFSSYNKTYGTLGGVVVFLLWLWLTNLALLFGAEVDAELERARELEDGLPAEQAIQLPLRDSRKIEKDEEKEAEDVRRARAIREQEVLRADEDGDAELSGARAGRVASE